MRPPIATLTRSVSHAVTKRLNAGFVTSFPAVTSCAPLNSTQLNKTHARYFSTTDKFIDYEGIDSLTRVEMEKRHKGIIMNTAGISQYVLPGDQTVKTNQKTGTKKMVAIERNMGYFWFIKDLKDTENKPVIANDELIPLDDSQVFPPLNAMNDGSLKTLTDEEVSLPQFFTKDNRAMDPSALCTLVAVNFNEFGNQMLPSWTEPFEHAFRNDENRVKTVWLSINEGRTLRLLKYFINNSSQKHVPVERKDRTLLFFGSCPELRDVLRMHNNKTGYVFLLDGLGRVRFAGSGKATDAELKTLIGFAKELTPGLKADGAGNVSLKTTKKKFNR